MECVQGLANGDGWSRSSRRLSGPVVDKRFMTEFKIDLYNSHLSNLDSFVTILFSGLLIQNEVLFIFPKS